MCAATKKTKVSKNAQPILSVENLSVGFGAGTPSAIEGVSYQVAKGEILCLVGESGSGKTVSALAAMGLLPDSADVRTGTIKFAGRELAKLSEKERRMLRGKDMSMIFQEPMTSLNPVLKVGEQVAEVFEIHTKLSQKEIKQKVLHLFEIVKIDNPERRYHAYPSQLSGGQRQRVMIAMALALEPKLLIADEPTTALDVTVQKRILDLLLELREKMGLAILFITHDFGVVRKIADNVAVMSAGKIVETGKTKDILENPQHDYTKSLLAAMPHLKPRQAEKGKDGAFLQVKNISKIFDVREAGIFSKSIHFHALDDISFSLAKGESVGVVGESGSGKSTLARCIMGLYDVSGGEVVFKSQNIAKLKGRELKQARRHMQMIFQDPFSSLNPRMRVGDSVAEGLRAHNMMPREEEKAFVAELLADCGLPEDAAERYPHQFSGGQRQRICIARAMALRPDLIVADEAVSALDVSVQKQILDLMAGLRKKYGLSYLFISHDLRVVSEVCDRVIVMQQGKIVEQGTTAEVFKNPKQPYTQKLLSAIVA